MFAVVLTTAVVVTETLADVSPAAIATVAGRLAADGADDVSCTRAPPGGAAAARVIVACAVVPPATEAGVRVTDATCGPAARVSDAVREKTYWAVTERLPGCARVVWVMANVAVVPPAGTLTDAGMLIPALVVVSVTRTPPAGAAASSVMVPVAVWFV